MILLHLGVFAIGVGYGLRLLGGAVPRGFSGNRVLAVWAAVFLLVCAQMLTYFRPILTVSAAGFRDEQKRFFFEHFLDSMRSDGVRAIAEQNAPSTDSAELRVPSAEQVAMQDD